MNWVTVATLGIPALIVVLGWFFAHRLTSQRELAAKRREARLKALEAAYMRLATSSNRPVTEETKDKIEMFVSEIQLYGTPKQIALMVEIVNAYMNSAPTILFDHILTDLRNTIRAELELEPIAGNIWWLRFPRETSSLSAQQPPDALPTASRPQNEQPGA